MPSISILEKLKSNPTTDRMPALFIGHGSPMNAIEDNAYSKSWNELGKQLPRPKAILSISAHWLTHGAKVTAMKQPVTIHDFGGFPPALFAAQYPAPGSPELAGETAGIISHTPVDLDYEWGLDHGTWSVLKPMYPLADIPVYQLSIDYWQSPEYHYELGKELAELRKKGVLIIGSGNLVHNLRMLRFDNPKPYDWAIEFDTRMKEAIEKGDHQPVIHFQQLGEVAKSAHPTYDHFLPLLYVLGLQQKNEQAEFFNNTFDLGSISMRSFVIA